MLGLGLGLTGRSVVASGAGVTPLAPVQAAEVGYTLSTFDGTFVASQVDTGGTNTPGKKWYPWNYFGDSADVTKITINGDGTVTLAGDTSGPNGELTTAGYISTGNWVGKAFGGGAYFEATLKFNPSDVINNSFNGCPAFWSTAIEHIAGLAGDTWSGQAGYNHFAELDFIEYDLAQFVPSDGNNFYDPGYHDWYGVGGTSQYNLPTLARYATIPSDTDFTQYHKYGCLWVPATSSTMGYVKYFFDDVQVGRTLTWQKNTGQSPMPAPAFEYTSDSEDYGWQGNNIRQVLAPTLLGAVTGAYVRVTFNTWSGGVGTIDSCFIGESAATGNESNYDGNQVRLTFEGGNSAGVANPSNLSFPQGYDTIVSDWVPFTYDSSKKLVIGLHVSGSDFHFVQETGLTGATVYTAVPIHTSASDPQADNSGVTAPDLANSEATTCIVSKVEISDYTPFGIVDSQHLVPIIGTGPNMPMTVQSVRVWQESDVNNLG